METNNNTELEQARKDLNEWFDKSKSTSKREKRIVLFLIVLPVVMLMAYWTSRTSYATHTTIIPSVVLIASMGGGIIIAGILMLNRLSRSIKPASQRISDYLHLLHSKLQAQIFGVQTKINPSEIKDPQCAVPGMSTHLCKSYDCSKWKYNLTYCSEFSYRDATVRICGVDAREYPSSDESRITINSIYLAVDTKQSINIPHSPLYIGIRNKEDPSQTIPLARKYKGKRKIKTMGGKVNFDSIDVISEPVANAILAIPQKAMLIVVEAWITNSGSFYYRLDGIKMDSVHKEGYEKTEEMFRNMYACLRDLVDASIDMISLPQLSRQDYSK